MSLALHIDEVGMLRSQLAAAWAEIQQLRRTIAHQAGLLKNLHPETHPAAPSLNCVYWLFSLAHEHEHSWKEHRNRLLPSLRGMGTMPAPEVTPVAWARHLAQRRHEPHDRGDRPGDHTLNIELGRLKGLLDWAVETQMIAFNPLRGAKKLKAVSRRETVLKPYDIETMLAAAEDLTDRRVKDGDDDGLRSKKLTALILAMFDSMLRPDEARSLRRSLIAENGDTEVTGKGSKKRIVTLTARTLAAINAIPEHPNSDWVFANADGERHGTKTLHRWFRWACLQGRLDAKCAPRDKRVVQHHLRHAGATAADAAGVRPGALQQTMGHSSLKTTEQYLHREALDSARHVAEKMTEATTQGIKRKGPRKSI